MFSPRTGQCKRTQLSVEDKSHHITLLVCDSRWVSASALHATRLHLLGSSSQYKPPAHAVDACPHLPQITVSVHSCQCKQNRAAAYCLCSIVAGSPLQPCMLRSARLHHVGSSSQYMAGVHVLDACSHHAQVNVSVPSCQRKKGPKVLGSLYATVAGSALQPCMLLVCISVALQVNIWRCFMFLTLVLTSHRYKSG